MLPVNMPLYRVAYFTNGNDVSTVLVDGRLLMRDRTVLSVNEEEVPTCAPVRATQDGVSLNLSPVLWEVTEVFQSNSPTGARPWRCRFERTSTRWSNVA